MRLPRLEHPGLPETPAGWPPPPARSLPAAVASMVRRAPPKSWSRGCPRAPNHAGPVSRGLRDRDLHELRRYPRVSSAARILVGLERVGVQIVTARLAGCAGPLLETAPPRLDLAARRHILVPPRRSRHRQVSSAITRGANALHPERCAFLPPSTPPRVVQDVLSPAKPPPSVNCSPPFPGAELPRARKTSDRSRNTRAPRPRRADFGAFTYDSAADPAMSRDPSDSSAGRDLDRRRPVQRVASTRRRGTDVPNRGPTLRNRR